MPTDNEDRKLAAFLREVANWDWETFCRAENDAKYTTNESLIFALVRACVMEKLPAMKLALNRLDGKLKTPVRIEYPKIFFLYPKATPKQDVKQNPLSVDIPVEDVKQIETGEIIAQPGPTTDDAPENDLRELSLRQTVAKMSDHPRQVPEAVIEYAHATQQWLNGNANEPEEKPMVKSVVAAHLLRLAQNRHVDALDEVFDQVDGKLVETIQILGEDLFITSYSLTAPSGAYLNQDGVLQLEASKAQDLWAEKLSKTNG